MGEFSGNFELETGNFNLFRGEGALNVPMGDKVAIRVAGRRIERDGYADSGMNNANSYSGRFSLRWEPTYQQSITMTADAEHSDDDLPAAMFHGIHYLDTFGGIEIVANTQDPDPALPYQGGGPVTAHWENKWALGNLALNFNEQKAWGATLIYDYEFDFATATVQFGHRVLREHKSSVNSGAYLEPVWSMQEPFPGAGFEVRMPAPFPTTQVWVERMDMGVFVVSHTSAHMDSYEARLTSKTSIPAGGPPGMDRGGSVYER